MKKSLDDKILDFIGAVLWNIGLVFFPIVDHAPEPIAKWLHRTGSWFSRKGLMIRDRNEKWMQIDKASHDERNK